MNNSDDTRNLLSFLAVAMIALVLYQIFYVDPRAKKAHEAQLAAAAASSSAAAVGLPTGPANLTREQALAQSPRVPIDTPSLKGSIALKGALLDDLYLTKYHSEVAPKSPNVELLRPAGAQGAYYIDSGISAQNLPGAPNNSTLWTLASGSVLSPGKPIVLTYDTGAGLKFTRTLSIDDNYMITEQDQVANTSAQPAAFAPYAQVLRYGALPNANHSNVHEGSIVTYTDKPGEYVTHQSKYHDLTAGKQFQEGDSTGGWYALTDKYWMTAVIPDQKLAVKYAAKNNADKTNPVFTTRYIASNWVNVAPGQTWTGQTRIFAGAKQDEMMRAYGKTLGIPHFERSLDWGLLGFLTYPFFLLLSWLFKMVGNYGVAILCLTVIIRAAFYPLAHRAQVQMVKMKHVQQHLQPKLDAIKKRFPDDMQKQQEATMQLYQQEKVNPMAGLGGCLPMLLTIPVFFCLAKVLQMDIGLRHAPFFGWITDLSAADPLSIVNLFGLLPFTPANVPLIGGVLATWLHIGPVAILYGASMWASQQMTPMTGIDPTQKQMMAFMPLIMVFFFTQLPIGLMIYYLWSNTLTMAQSYIIYRQLKVDNPVDQWIAKLSGKSEKKAA
ncbi:MAG TPA: membrane protein insertase YidC [Asticcacaulis sp.]|nr:membrane protein insertase YidC [Asticcacaulis sp.]